MDLNDVLRQSRLALAAEPASLTPRDKLAYDQFTREYAEQTRMTRAALLGSTR
jgi:hypothetical protein